MEVHGPFISHEGKFFDPVNALFWATNFVVGDVIRYRGGGGSYGDDIQGLTTTRDYTISAIEGGVSVGSLYYKAPNELSSYYYTVYTQKLWLKDVPKTYAARHFNIVRNGTPMALQIGVDRPCLVFELEETTATDGKVTVKRKTDKGKPFDSMSAARVYTEAQIVDSIRKDNVYPKFSIYEERYVARAEKPPVVFE